MAILDLSGKTSTVRLTSDPEDGGTVARCVLHNYTVGSRHPGCGWTKTYDTLNDAAEYAADHADYGRR